MNDVQVRGATLSDIEAIARIGHETWPATYGFAGDAYIEHGLRTWWSPEAIRRDVETTRAFVAVVDGEVVGMGTIDLRLDNPTIWKLYVLPGFHGTGVGHALLTRLLQEAGTGARVELEYTDGNTRAARFYRAHGFVESYREPASVEGWPAAIWMVRSIDA